MADIKLAGPYGSKEKIRHMRHPGKDGLLTLAGDEDCDIPKLTHEFCLGVADLDEHDDVPDRN